MRSLKDLTSSGELEHLAPDLVYKVAYSIGNQCNTDLNSLLVELLRLLKTVPVKFRLCEELLTWRTSPFLTEILLQQLKLVMMADVNNEHAELWTKVYSDLPEKLEKRLCQRLMSQDEELRHATVEATHILTFFSETPVRIAFKFSRLTEDMLTKLAFDDASAYPFLVWYAKEHPFSPRLLGLSEPAVLIPNVYDQRYLQQRLSEGVIDYLNDENKGNEDAIRPLTNALNFLLKIGTGNQNTNSSDIQHYPEMFTVIFRYIDDRNMKTQQRLLIMEILKEIMSRVPVVYRVLLLKDVIARIVNGILRLKNESGVLFWALDQIEQNLDEKAFVDELGSLFGLLEAVAWKDPTDATADYVSSVVRIVRHFAHNCSSLPLLAEARERLLIRFQKQIADCIHGDLLNTESSGSKKPTTVVQPAASELASQSAQLQLSLVLKECEETIVDVDEVLQKFSRL